jgi:LPXTG-motif cell wall-anchored protein
MHTQRSVHSLPATVLACLAVTVLVGLGLAAPSYAGNGNGATAATKAPAAKPAKSSGKAPNHVTSGTAGTSGDVSSPQPTSKADQNSGGANGKCPGGPYCSTRDGSPSGNGNGGGKATGKPCAGCVGKADNKNPKGQNPNGSDNNAGYECDRNHGVGRTNPAHTGCTGTTTPPPSCVDNPKTPRDECGTTTPPGQCTDNPATPVDECGTTTPPGQCTDNPKTPADECGTTTPPGQCTDNPATPDDECSSVLPPESPQPPLTPVGPGTVSAPTGPSAAATVGRTVAPQGVLPNTGAPEILPVTLAGLLLLGAGAVVLRRRTA